MAIEATRWFLACFFVAVAAIYTVQILRMKRRDGRSPVRHGARGSPQWRNATAFRVFRVVILLVCVARVPWPQTDLLLGPLWPLWRAPVVLTGDALLLVGLVGAQWCRRTMGPAWRSGIDEERPPRLITGGPFAYSRHPTFVFVQLAQLGLFLALPTAFTLVCLLVGVAVVRRQAALEEAALLRQYGRCYAAYAARTPKWLGLVPLRR